MQLERGYWLPTFVLLLSFSSCSLMGLDDLGVSPCSSDLECEKMAQRYPSPFACATSRCQEGLCAWVEGQELCNGQDDDCDGLIDEDIVVSTLEEPVALVAPADVGYASDATTGITFIAVPSGDGVSVGSAVTETELKLTESLRYASEKADGELACPKLALDGEMTSRCNFSEVALAVDDRHLVVASINTIGCTMGQVRIGLGDRRRAPFEVWLGKALGANTEELSNIANGVDIALDDPMCTGASRAVSTTGIPSRGATRPAVASLGTAAGAEGALVLWLGASANPPVEQRTNACTAMDPVPVEALGVFVPEGEPDWLNGTNGGIPLHLGDSTRLSAPAVVALGMPAETPSYVVAFPGEQGGKYGIQLLSVRSVQDSLSSEVLDFIDDESPDHVSLALGRTDGPVPEVGMVWSSGCGSNTQLRFAVINPLSRNTLAMPPLRIASPHLSLRPQLLYRASGFSAEEPGGGWFLLWVEAMPASAPVLQMARIGEGSLRLLNQVALRSGDVGYPVLLPSGDWSAGYARVQQYEANRSDVGPFVHWCGDMP